MIMSHKKILRDLIIQFVRFVSLQYIYIYIYIYIKQDNELVSSSLKEFHKLAIIIEKDTF